MKVAICYSGMFRDFLECVENHKKFLIDNYDCDVYLHLWDVYGFGGVSKKYNSINDNKISKQDIDKILSILTPKKYIFEQITSKEKELSEIADSISKHDFQPYTKNVLSMYYKIHQVGELMNQSNVNYDIVVRMRTDILFRDKILFNIPLQSDTVYSIKNWCWGDHTMSDLFLFGNYKSMSYFHDMYNHLKSIWEKVGPYQSPEHLIYVHFKNGNIQIKKEDIFLDLRRELVK